MRRLAVLLIGVILVGNICLADDYNPPPWERGSPGTTYQRWEFGKDNSGKTPPPDEISPEHPGVALSVVGDAPLTVWLPYDPEETDREGLWKLEDYIQIDIQNFDEDNPLKRIWIQLTYTADSDPLIYAEVPGSAETYMGSLIDEQTIPGSDYVYATFEIRIEPNPASETIYIQPWNCTAYIDEIVIDTICTPEPGTLCLLGFGALVLLRKRRV
ncbi:MAG: PEP-CTERM sorting domain-containing protein [Planctomycetota bacterium]|jgi:hypothetical protein